SFIFALNFAVRLRLFFEVFVLEDVGRGANEPEADGLVTGVTRREGVAAEHHDLVRSAVRMRVVHLIDPALRHRIASRKTMRLRVAAVVLPAWSAGLG